MQTSLSFHYTLGEHRALPLKTKLDALRIEAGISENVWGAGLTVTDYDGHEIDLSKCVFRSQFPVEVHFDGSVQPEIEPEVESGKGTISQVAQLPIDVFFNGSVQPEIEPEIESGMGDIPQVARPETPETPRAPIATSMVKGAITGGSVGGVLGWVSGAALGGATGVIAAPFTLGLSVPAGAAVGSCIGAATGVTTGSTVGLISGGVIAYRTGQQGNQLEQDIAKASADTSEKMCVAC